MQGAKLPENENFLVKLNQHNEFSSSAVTATNVALRRERHRACMARYRKRLLDKENDQERERHALQKEIQDLKEMREVMSSRVLISSTPWSVAGEYFRLFRFGSKAFSSALDPFGVTGSLEPHDPRVQLSFLREVMAPDVMFGTTSSVEGVMANWKFITLCYEDLDIELKCLECGDGDSVLATTSGKFTVTENTLRYAFPHLMNDGCGLSSLAAKLLGQRVQMSGSLCFDWDSSNKRVVRLVYKSDLLTPLLRLLGNLEDVSLVFGNAQVTPESRLANENIHRS